MTIALNTLRVEWAAAVLITLTYRLITFWFPLAVGGSLSASWVASQTGTRLLTPQ